VDAAGVVGGIETYRSAGSIQMIGNGGSYSTSISSSFTSGV